MRWRVLVVLGMALVVVGGATWRTSWRGPAKRTITGTFTLNDNARRSAGALCAGTGGYSDIVDGAQVRVTDDKGQLLGVSFLLSGVAANVATAGAISIGDCRWRFVVSDLADRPFYQVEVSHRGAISYSRADLEAANWTVELSLGNG